MIDSIRLQNFRSYKDESFEFESGVNIIVGPNASGKTNLLEAILVTASGFSYRAKDTDLIMFEQPWARIDINSPTGHRTIKLINENNGSTRKELIIDEQILRRIQLQRTIPVVLFEPNHLALLHGPPELRRDYLDNLLEQTVPGFNLLRKNYRRALTQRNALLKHGNPTHDQMFVWNLRLSDMGGQIAHHRQNLINHMSGQVTEGYSRLSQLPSEVELVYQSTCEGSEYSSRLLHKLQTNQEKDIQRGFTGHGPHRDDLLINLNGHDAEDTASRGETRTLMLVFKIMELSIVEEARGVSPLLLLDDVFSELDGARRKALTEAIKGYQTFITTTDADVVVQHFMGNCHIIPLN